MRDRQEKYHHSLKALAIRERKIHIVGRPKLKIEGTPIYLDVEGLPDHDFYYLIGVCIGSGDSAVHHSLWAYTAADEAKIWREFLSILETVEKPLLIHYGSDETTFLKRMGERHGNPPERSPAAEAIKAAVNLLPVIFAQVCSASGQQRRKRVAPSGSSRFTCRRPPSRSRARPFSFNSTKVNSKTPNNAMSITFCAAM